MNKTRYLVQAALIAAIYAVLTIAFAPLSFGSAQSPIQVRISEALTVLPAVFPPAIPGLYVGCVVSNIYGMSMGLGAGIFDVIFGSLATLIAAYMSYKMPKKWLVPFPPVIVNAVVLGVLFKLVYNLPLLITAGTIFVGQFIACYALGYPLLLIFDKYKDKIISK